MTELAKIHVSDLLTWKLCRLRWTWSSNTQRNLEPSKPYTPFLAGRAAHHGLERVHEPGFDAAAVIKEYFDGERINMEQHGTLWEEEVALLEEQQDLITGILRHYVEWEAIQKGAFAKDNLEIVDVERKFEVPLRDPYGTPSDKVVLAGRIDGVVRRKDNGELWLREYKTCRSIPERVRILPFDEQPNVYLIAAEEIYGERPAGVVYDLLRKKLPAEPRVLQDGTLSKATSQLKLTPAHYLACIKRHHGEDATQEFIRYYYGDILQTLMRGEKSLPESFEFFRRVALKRTPFMLDNARRDLWIVAHEMVDPGTYQWPHGGHHCGFCIFRTPCQIRREGGDYESILATEYQQRTDHGHDIKETVDSDA